MSNRGHTNNNFGTSEFEQSAANKKKQSESSIFGSNKDTVTDPPPVKQTRNTGNNIFRSDREENHDTPATLAGQYKQSQMKSNIFGTDEPTSTRHVSDKNKSNIFGIGDNDQNKGQAGTRQGRRDPNASRMGYNPINGEAYTPKDNVNEKQPEPTVKPSGEENSNGQPAPANTTENGNGQAAPANTNGKGNNQKADPAANENNAQKNVHTSVRVVHPPGGKSNGPLW